MNKILLVIALALGFITLSAQGNRTIPKGFIIGTVIDNGNDLPLEFATLSLYDAKKDEIVGGGITDIDGKFKIDAKPGLYYIKIEFISYSVLKIESILVKPGGEAIDLGRLKLEIDGETLDEVVISEERSQVQLSLDKKVFNVGKDLTNKGGTAEDILNNVPSVEVDLEGGVTLRGSGGVRILIDGKPSMMVGEGNTNGLRNLPSSMIEKVEVITNPSARYEAEGMSGIINIVLKKDKKKGFNGSFDFSGGLPVTAGAAFNLNYRTKKLNLFTSLGVRQRTSPGGGFSNQESRFIDGTSDIYNSTRSFNRGGVSSNISLGMDYFFDEKNIITSAFSFRRSLENNNNLTQYEDFEGSLANLVSTTDRFDDEKENEFDTEYALTYEKKLKGKGHNLLADLRFQDNTEIESSDYREVYMDGLGNPLGTDDFLQRSGNNEGERRLNMKVDYTKPLANKGKLESGLQSSYRLIRNDYLVENFDMLDWVRQAGLSNEFNYDEFINAAYGIYGKEYSRWSYQLGVRAEHSRVVTELQQSDEPANDRSYLNLFPSAHVSFNVNEKNAFQVSYSRRIRRPRFWDLNPFFTFSDPRNLFSGNPNLNPEFSDSYEVGYIKYFEKGSLTSSIYYRHTTDVIQRVREVDANGITNLMPQNLSSQDNFGFEFTGAYRFTKWWNLNGNLNLFRSITDGGNLGEDFAADTYSYFSRLNNKLTFSKTLEAQVSVRYSGPRVGVQGRSKASGGIDVGIGKEFPKKKISLTLNVRDIFNTNRRQSTSEFDLFDDAGSFYGTYYSESQFRWRSRSAVLSLNYRINQEKKRSRGRNGGGFEGGEGEMF